MVYTVTVKAYTDESTVQIQRIRVLETANESVFFEDITLDQGSSASIELTSQIVDAAAAISADTEKRVVLRKVRVFMAV